MKFTIEKEILTKAFSVVLRAVAAKSNITALECVFIEAKDNMLILKASNNEMSITTKVAANVHMDGTIVIPSKTNDLFRTYTDSKVDFFVDEHNLINIKCASSEVSILGKNPREYPSGNDLYEACDTIKLSQETLKSIIKDTVFAAAVATSNPILTGVFMEYAPGSLSFTALDGFKMAHRTVKLDNDSEKENFSVIIPARTLNEVYKVLMINEGEAEMFVRDKKLIINIGEDTQIALNLLDGIYLNYRTLIPQSVNTMVKVQRDELLTCVERASIIMDETRNSVIKLDFEADVLTIRSQTEHAKVVEQMKVFMNGENIKIAFNSKYYIEILKNITDDKVLIEFTDKSGPCSIKPIEDGEYMYLVMPVRYME